MINFFFLSDIVCIDFWYINSLVWLRWGIMKYFMENYLVQGEVGNWKITHLDLELVYCTSLLIIMLKCWESWTDNHKSFGKNNWAFQLSERNALCVSSENNTPTSTTFHWLKLGEVKKQMVLVKGLQNLNITESVYQEVD